MILNSILPVIIKYKFTILFYFLVVLIVYLNRKRFDVHGKLIYLYRTKIGIKFMNNISSKFGKFLKYVGYVGIFIGFAGMILTFVLILYSAYKLTLNIPGATGASPVIPGLPIAGTGLFFPLVTGWIALFIIIVVHECSHGIVSLAHNVKIKSSGMAFFGPILGAFVEPDEKKLSKEKDSVQHSVFAAGPFSNILLWLFLIFIIIPLFVPIVNSMVFSTGVIVSPQPGLPADKAGLGNYTIIVKVNDVDITDTTGLQKLLENVGPNETVTLSSANQTFTLITTENPDDPSKGYLGIWLYGNKVQLKSEGIIVKTIYKMVTWLLGLFVWVAFLSINIGLINLFPIFITDGARMLKIACDGFFKNKKLSMSVWLGINWLSVFLLLLLVFLPFLRWMSTKFGSILVNLLV